jgi:hypothetical protein
MLLRLIIVLLVFPSLSFATPMPIRRSFDPNRTNSVYGMRGGSQSFANSFGREAPDLKSHPLASGSTLRGRQNRRSQPTGWTRYQAPDGSGARYCDAASRYCTMTDYEIKQTEGNIYH